MANWSLYKSIQIQFVLSLISFHTIACGKERERERGKGRDNKKANRVFNCGLPSSPLWTPSHIAFVHVSLPPAGPYVPYTPTHTYCPAEQPGSRATPPLPHPPSSLLFLPSLKNQEVGIRQNKGPSAMGLAPYCPRHTGVYLGPHRTVKGTRLSPFTVAALNELVEGMH